jgi:hypothetical protein
MDLTPKKLKSGNYDQAEHSTWREHVEAWKYSMHKVHRDYKNFGQRRNGELLIVMEVGRRRQSAVAEMYRSGMVH